MSSDDHLAHRGEDPVRAELARARRAGTTAWVWLLVGGTVAVVLGVVSIASPQVSVGVLAVVLSLWLLGTGFARIGLAAAMRTWTPLRRGLQGAVGAALAVGGLTALLGLWSSQRLLALLVAAGFLAAAAADLLLAATGPRGLGRLATGALGVGNLVVGLVFLLLPQVGLTLLAVLVGVALVGLGLVQLGAALLVRGLLRGADALAARLDTVDTSRRPGGPDDPDDPRVIRGEVI